MRGAALLACLLVLATPLSAQENGPSRPDFLAAMGLLETREERIEGGSFPAVTIELPTSDQVAPRPRETSAAGDDVLAAWEFVTPDGALVETLSITTARVDQAEPEARRFAMANLLVLRSYPQLAARVAGARLAGFAPLEHDGALDAVHAIGEFETEDGAPFAFRHVGFLAPETEAALVALVGIATDRMPVRSQADLADTYSGLAIRSIRLAPEE